MPIFELTGKKSHKTRNEIMFKFKSRSNTNALLLCTDLASRGLDFEEIDYVIQYDLAENIDTYIHRVGRTARFCSSGKSIIFIDKSFEMKYIN